MGSRKGGFARERRSGPEQRGGSHCVQGLEDGVVWDVTNLRHMKVCYVERSIVK